MTDPSDGTPAPEIHPLSGSTLPGAGTLDKLQATPKPKPSSPGIPDEREVCALAQRLVALLKREPGLVRRLDMLRLHALLPDKQVALEKVIHRTWRRIDRRTRRLAALKAPTARAAGHKAAALIQTAEVDGRGADVFDALAVSLAHDVGGLALEAANLPQHVGGNFARYHPGILEAHAAMEAAPIGTPDAEFDVHMDRWGAIDRLAMMDRPRGVADAAAALAYARREFHQFHVEVHEGHTDICKGDLLILHLLDGAAAALRPYTLAAPVSGNDTPLFDLIVRHGPALAELIAADEMSRAPYAAYSAVALRRPDALYWRAGDRTRPATREPAPDSTTYRFIYVEADVERMRKGQAFTVVEHRSPAPWNIDEVVVRCERVPDPVGEARRVEIVAAWDAWQAEKAAVSESSGLDAANAVSDAASDALSAIEEAIQEYQPATFAGLQAKARWIAANPCPADHARHVLRDLCAMAPPSDADDAPLLAAVAEFCRVDDLQDYLCRTYHADTDDIPGYAETEAPWSDWLDQVADRPALTWGGIVAKAATMKRHTVHHDQHKSDMIGESLAEDILRLAGQTWDERSNRTPSAVWNTIVERAA